MVVKRPHVRHHHHRYRQARLAEDQVAGLRPAGGNSRWRPRGRRAATWRGRGRAGAMPAVPARRRARAVHPGPARILASSSARKPDPPRRPRALGLRHVIRGAAASAPSLPSPRAASAPSDDLRTPRALQISGRPSAVLTGISRSSSTTSGRAAGARPRIPPFGGRCRCGCQVRWRAPREDGARRRAVIHQHQPQLRARGRRASCLLDQQAWVNCRG